MRLYPNKDYIPLACIGDDYSVNSIPNVMEFVRNIGNRHSFNSMSDVDVLLSDPYIALRPVHVVKTPKSKLIISKYFFIRIHPSNMSLDVTENEHIRVEYISVIHKSLLGTKTIKEYMESPYRVFSVISSKYTPFTSKVAKSFGLNFRDRMETTPEALKYNLFGGYNPDINDYDDAVQIAKSNEFINYKRVGLVGSSLAEV